MMKGFSVEDGSLLYGLLAEGGGDILLKTDSGGFLAEVSPGLERFGLDLSGLLLAPHIADLARRSHGDRVRAYWHDVVAGRATGERIEFPIAGTPHDAFGERWFALALRRRAGPEGEVAGTIGILRPIERRREIEQELLAASMTDPLTGLGNRQACIALLSRFLAGGLSGAVILFGIDRFRAITLNHGQSKGDEVLWAFAQYLRTVLGEQPVLARLEGERFAAILSDTGTALAQALAWDAVTTFAQLARESSGTALPVSASAGIAAIARSCDAVLASAELALTLAQAAGGARAELRGEAAALPMSRLRA